MLDGDVTVKGLQVVGTNVTNPTALSSPDDRHYGADVAASLGYIECRESDLGGI